MIIKLAKDLVYGDVIVQVHTKYRVYTPFISTFQHEIILDEPKSFSTFGYHGVLQLNEIVSEFEYDDFKSTLDKLMEIDGNKLLPPREFETWDTYPFIALEKNEYKY